MTPRRVAPVFSDKVVTPTELARHVKDITQRALHRPVTIHRPEGDLALLGRGEVAELVAAATASEDLAGFAESLVWLLRGRGQPAPAFAWIQAFGPDDVADFLEEYLAAVRQATSGQGSWDRVSDVLHEWEESAHALTRHDLLAELATFRGVASEGEAPTLSPDELRMRLERALGRERDAQ